MEDIPIKLLSNASRCAIRAMMCALEMDSLPRFSTAEVCRKADIPEAFARKALQEMAKAGIIRGVLGPGGGYLLIRELSQISLLDIVLAVDGQHAFDECPMGLRCQAQIPHADYSACENCTLPHPKCGLSHICPLHDLWKETRRTMIGQLKSTTLYDIKNRLTKIPGALNV